MSETPGGPEYYQPSSEPPPPPQPPPSISDAAQQWTLSQDGGAADVPYQAPAPPPAPGVPQPYAYAQPYAPTYGYAPPQPTAPSKQGLAITALVLGLIALVTGWVPVWGMVLGAVAVVLGGIAVAKRQSKGMAITGIVTGAIGAVTSLGVLVALIYGANWATDPDNWMSYSPGDYYDGSGTTLGPESVDGGLVVTEQTFGNASWDETYWWYVVVLNNPSDLAYPSSEVTIQALDASGAVIDTSFSYASIHPGENAFTGVFFELGDAEIASLAVVGPPADALTGDPQDGALTIGEMTATSDEWSTTVTGSVASSFADDVYAPSVVVVARDPSGAVIGAATAYVDTVTPGAAAPFEAYFFEALPDGTTYQAYWSTY